MLASAMHSGPLLSCRLRVHLTLHLRSPATAQPTLYQMLCATSGLPTRVAVSP